MGDLWLGRVVPCMFSVVSQMTRMAAEQRGLCLAPKIPQHLQEVAHANLLWEVVGGADRGGIIVRAGREISSQKLEERLSCGSLVRQEDLVGERLCFTRLSGTGP